MGRRNVILWGIPPAQVQKAVDDFAWLYHNNDDNNNDDDNNDDDM